MSIENKQITIEDLAQYYSNDQLIKPRLNRDLRWSFEHTKLFLEFTFGIRHILTPFLCTKTIVNINKEVYSVFDGNNRMNAIFSFASNPLKYMEFTNDALKRVLCSRPNGNKIHDLIQNMSYAEIMNTTSLSMLCRKHKNAPEINAFDWVKENEDADYTIETAYNTMHKSISDTKFNNVKLTLTVFSGMTDEEIVDIFQNINTSGMELTPQDILKATSSLTTYRADEITEFGKIVQHYRKFADDQCDKEVLGMETEYSMLSCFELLFGLQLWMSCEYPQIVDSPGKKGVKMDLIFKLHKSSGLGVREKNAEALNKFVCKFIESVEYLKIAYDKMYGLIASVDKLALTLNKQFIMHTWYFTEGNTSIKFGRSYLSVLLYDSLCGFVKDKTHKKMLDEESPLAYHNGGQIVWCQAMTIKETGTISRIPTGEQISKLIQHLLNQNIAPCAFDLRKRKCKSIKFESLLLNLYFYKHVPPHVREEEMNIDHIIPISTNGWSGDIDINRIGNKMMINSRVNIRKGCRALTNEFMIENKLVYYNYPSEDEYTRIVVDGIVQQKEFNEFCEKREKAYMDNIVSI